MSHDDNDDGRHNCTHTHYNINTAIKYTEKEIKRPLLPFATFPCLSLTEQNLGNYSRVSITMTALQILSKLENLHVNVFVQLLTLFHIFGHMP